MPQEQKFDLQPVEPQKQEFDLRPAEISISISNKPNETTKLTPSEESSFQNWAKTNKITDVDHPDSYYDYRGFWKETKGAPHPPGDILHFPDTYKQHGHPTFSIESKYSKGSWDGGKWEGDKFIPQENAEPVQEGILRRTWDAATTSLAPEFTPKFKLAQEEFKKEHPYLGAAGEFGLESLRSLATPVNLATMGAVGAEGLAAKAGLKGLQKGVEVGRRLLSAPMIAEGAENLIHGETLPEKAMGALEAVGGWYGTFGGGTAFNTARVPLPKPQLTPAAEGAVNKLQKYFNLSQKLRNEQEAIYTAEKSQRILEAKKIKPESVEEFNKQKSALAGEYEKVIPVEMQLNQDETTSLFRAINDFATDDEFKRIHAREGLTKLLEGSEVPQQHELNILKNIFGEQFIHDLTTLPKIDVKRRFLQEMVNLPRAIQSSMDISAPLRQGLPMISRKEWWTSWPSMIKSGLSENAYQGVMQSIVDNPYYGIATHKNIKLALTDLLDLTRREEAIMSNWAEKIPGVHASNRAYAAFLNKLRMDSFASLMRDAERAGLDPKNNYVLAKQIANYVNDATGRGSLGKAEQAAVYLNGIFYSPRMIASRVNMLNPMTYAKVDPFVRKQYIRSLLSTAAFWGTITGLGAYSGLGETSLDPTSSDFGKLRFGNIRVDPPAGFQQYLVAATRFLRGQTTSASTGNTTQIGRDLLLHPLTPMDKPKYRQDTAGKVLARFGANKLAPIPNFAWDIFDPLADHFPDTGTKEEAAKLFIPMFMQDVWEVAHEEPGLVPWLGPLSAAGMGVQNYSR